VQGVFEESLVWSMILQPILHRKPVRGSVIEANFSLSMHLLQKKIDMNRNKKTKKCNKM